MALLFRSGVFRPSFCGPRIIPMFMILTAKILGTDKRIYPMNNLSQSIYLFIYKLSVYQLCICLLSILEV